MAPQFGVRALCLVRLVLRRYADEIGCREHRLSRDRFVLADGCAGLWAEQPRAGPVRFMQVLRTLRVLAVELAIILLDLPANARIEILRTATVRIPGDLQPIRRRDRRNCRVAQFSHGRSCAGQRS